MLDPGLTRHVPVFYSELKKRFEMVGGKSDGNDEHLLDIFFCEFPNGVGRRRREPFERTDLRLVTEAAILRVAAAFHNHIHRFLDMSGIRVPLTDEFHRRPMGAENQVDVILLVHGKAPEPLVYTIRKRVDVGRKVIIRLDQRGFGLEFFSERKLLVPLLDT